MSTSLIYKHNITTKDGTEIPFWIRGDDMVHATNIYKATKKHFHAYQITQTGIKDITNVQNKTGLTKYQLVKTKKGGLDSGTWIHKELIRYYCKWISLELEKLVIKLLDGLENKDKSKWIFDIKADNERLTEENNRLNSLIQIKSSTHVEPQLLEYKLTLNDKSEMIIPVRSDGMINATVLCKAANKRIYDYLRLESTEAYLQALSRKTGQHVKDLIRSNIGGNHSGTWIHRKVAYNLAQWCDPNLAVQVFDWFTTDNIVQNKIKHINSTLVLNNIEIQVRPEDGYVNLTQLNKAGGKNYFHWKENNKTKAFLEALSLSIGLPMDKLIKYESGPIQIRATWAHPQVAINNAQWISPEFDVQVSAWIFELLTTGSVQAGNEKSTKELDNYYKEQLSVEKIKYNEIEVKYERMLKPVIANKYSEKDIRENIEEMRVNLLRSLPSIVNRCHVYSAVIDIQIKDGVFEVVYKVGFTSDVNERFKQHKKSYPMFIPIAIMPVSSIKIESEVHASIPSELRVKYNNEREIYKYDDLPSKFVEYIQDIVQAKDVHNKDDRIKELENFLRIYKLEAEISNLKLENSRLKADIEINNLKLELKSYNKE